MPRTNETRHRKWHETCKCKCRLDASICNNKQRWNKDKCRCECKELIDKRICDIGFIWNPSNLDHQNCKCTNKLVDKLVEQCSENIGENEMVYNKTLSDYREVYNSWTIYTELFVIVFLIINGFSSAYYYFYWYLKRR